MSDIVEDLIAKTMAELSEPEKPQQRSRVWKDPKGYTYLVQWSNAVLLRYFIRLYTNSLPKAEYRRKAQLDDAARSVVRNIEEGYKRATTSEYTEFIGFSQGSLEEVGGDIRELTEDGFLPSKPSSSLQGIGISLQDFHNALRAKYHTVKEIKGMLEDEKEAKNPQYSPRSFTPAQQITYIPLSVLYPPLGKITAEDLTYEIFIELINKTDFLLRKLVESLERKLTNEQKYYRVEQERIKDKVKLK